MYNVFSKKSQFWQNNYTFTLFNTIHVVIVCMCLGHFWFLLALLFYISPNHWLNLPGSLPEGTNLCDFPFEQKANSFPS